MEYSKTGKYLVKENTLTGRDLVQESIYTFHTCIYKELNFSYLKVEYIKTNVVLTENVWEYALSKTPEIFSLYKDNMVCCRSTQIIPCWQCWIESIFFLYNYIRDLSIFYEIKCVNNWFPVCNGVIDGRGLTKLYCFFFLNKFENRSKETLHHLSAFDFVTCQWAI